MAATRKPPDTHTSPPATCKHHPRQPANERGSYPRREDLRVIHAIDAVVVVDAAGGVPHHVARVVQAEGQLLVLRVLLQLVLRSTVQAGGGRGGTEGSFIHQLKG